MIQVNTRQKKRKAGDMVKARWESVLCKKMVVRKIAT